MDSFQTSSRAFSIRRLSHAIDIPSLALSMYLRLLYYRLPRVSQPTGKKNQEILQAIKLVTILGNFNGQIYSLSITL